MSGGKLSVRPVCYDKVRAEGEGCGQPAFVCSCKEEPAPLGTPGPLSLIAHWTVPFIAAEYLLGWAQEIFSLHCLASCQGQLRLQSAMGTGSPYLWVSFLWATKAQRQSQLVCVCLWGLRASVAREGRKW